EERLSALKRVGIQPQDLRIPLPSPANLTFYKRLLQAGARFQLNCLQQLPLIMSEDCSDSFLEQLIALGCPTRMDDDAWKSLVEAICGGWQLTKPSQLT